jgi:hypothetical protein
MIYVVDLIRRGDEHRTTNHPSLQVLAENKLIKHLWISYDSTSFNDLELKQDFSTTHIRVSSDKKYRWITSTLLTIAILLKSKKNSTDVIFLSTTPLHNFLISLFSRYTKNQSKFFIYVHGELSYLIEANGIGRRLGKYFLNYSLKNSAINNTVHITLAYPVYKQVCQLYKFNNKLRNLEIPTRQYIQKFRPTNSGKLKVGSFGVHCADKNSQLIYTLANNLENYKDIVEIVTIGAAHKDFHYDQHPMVKHLCRGDAGISLIPREIFIEQICSLDLALIFYGSSRKYEFVSSGVFSDCVNHCIPFAGLQSHYLSYYIEKYGELGLVRDNLVDLSKEIITIAKNRKRIALFQDNLMALNKELNYSNFKNNLISIIKE